MTGRIKHIVLLLALMLSAGLMRGQQLPVSNEFVLNRYALTPAFTGLNKNVEAFVNYRKDWLGVDGAPETKSVSINGEVAPKMGVGFTISQDQVGIFSSLRVSGAYAYTVKIDQSQDLRFGVNLDFTENKVVPNFAETADLSDPMISSFAGLKQNAFNAGLAVAYRYKKWRAGLYVPRLLTNKLTEQNLNYTLVRHYTAHLNYDYRVNKAWSVEPTLVMQSSFNANMNLQFVTTARYQNKLWAGLGYRTGNNVSLLVGGVPFKRTVVTYSYETGFGGMIASSSGTHELTLGFLVGKIKHKSQPGASPSLFDKDDQPYYDWLD